MGPDALPQWYKNRIEGLNAIRCGSFSEGSQCQGGDGTHLLLFINQSLTATEVIII